MEDKRVTYFAETDARNKRVKFGIKAIDRTKHVYVIGKTGMGKSTLLENMAVQDIQSGEGIAFIDPHGKTADLLLEYVPKHRIKDVVYIAPFDTEYPISFNVLESVDRDKRHLVVSGLMSTFKKIWEDAWSARMEYILTNTLLALLEYPGSTLLGVNRMLSDKEYRKDVVAHIEDPSVKAFWTKEFANYSERMAQDAVPAIQNKVGQFTANPLIRNMIGQSQSSFSFREAMDTRKIMIINLSKGKIGDENMKLLGGMLVTKMYLAAMSRADVPDRALKLLPHFYLFVDEFQNFANASFADILSEARKYKLNLTIAHQYIEQMDEKVRAAVFGNVGTMITFRVGATDAEVLEKEFTPPFTIEDLVNLGYTQIYLKLMIDGLTSPPFSAVTLPPIPHPDESHVTEIIAASRAQFARSRTDVEVDILKFHEPTVPKKIEASKEVVKVVSSAKVTAAPIGKSKADIVIKPTISPGLEQKRESPPQQRVVKEKSKQEPAPRTDLSKTEVAKQEVSNPEIAKPEMSKPEISKPLPLSSLGSKSTTAAAPARQDPKRQSKQNVDDLKSVLASVLKREKTQQTQPQSPRNHQVQSQPKSQLQPQTQARSQEPITQKPSPVAQPLSPQTANQSEVPEDVLKNVLKVD